MKTPNTLVRQRCYNHASREAVARCPECQRFFCRECVSEHDDRLLCAACLSKLAKPSFSKRFYLTGLLKVIPVMLGFLCLWWFFYLVGQILLAIPAEFHEGALW
ncbi:rhomboid family protein [candidate division KSB3 bacterium]|uniref:Rhomboid family protein n=1 Tax=candidate division KSB3 bacterium TaxID=2044937 RepID=A0A2G6KIV9_9BACT|nr:MAG: rhomboid family protein [candidate division KSB3 bacterium]